MCGIVGILAQNQNTFPDPSILEAMKETLAHRGPDDDGSFVDEKVALGMRRLSIIDLEAGQQPVTNEDGSIQVVCNGEIYNYQELTKDLLQHGHRFQSRSDTESLVHAYEQWGLDFLSKINGMFAFALWDARCRRLILARDQAGIKPLYYAQAGSSLVFGSEIKALLAHPGIDRELDAESLSHYLSFEYVPTPHAIFSGIRKLKPGHYLIAEGRSLQEICYWDFDIQNSESVEVTNPASHVKHFAKVLEEAVATEMVSDVPVGVLLSGGLDSSAVAAMMTRVSDRPIKSFSVGFAEGSFDEAPYARQVARYLNTEHHEMLLTPKLLLSLIPILASHIDEPFADPSIIPTYFVSKLAREHVKVALGGDGGDEMLAGYSTLQAHRVSPMYRRLPAMLRTRLIEPLVSLLPVSYSDFSLDFKATRFIRGAGESRAIQHQMWLGSFFGEQKLQLLSDDFRQQIVPNAENDFLETTLQSCNAKTPLNRILYQDLKLYLEGGILPKVDRASMAVSLETRVPLLNSSIMNFLADTPLEFKLRGLTRKWLLRQAMSGKLPDNIISRPKKGFAIPIAQWLLKDLREMAQDYLAPDRLQRQGIFNPAVVSALLAGHLDQRQNNHKMLWTLLMFQLWWDNWMYSS